MNGHKHLQNLQMGLISQCHQLLLCDSYFDSQYTQHDQKYVETQNNCFSQIKSVGSKATGDPIDLFVYGKKTTTTDTFLKITALYIYHFVIFHNFVTVNT